MTKIERSDRTGKRAVGGVYGAAADVFMGDGVRPQAKTPSLNAFRVSRKLLSRSGSLGKVKAGPRQLC